MMETGEYVKTHSRGINNDEHFQQLIQSLGLPEILSMAGTTLVVNRLETFDTGLSAVLHDNFNKVNPSWTELSWTATTGEE